MAQMVPGTMPEKASAGEKRTFAALAQLDDDCIVYYEPVVAQRHPDFVVIIPDAGVIIIEVKGLRLGEIRSANTNELQVHHFGNDATLIHPSRQAREYKLQLMAQCGGRGYARSLLRQQGRHKGKPAVPFGHFVILSYITRDQIEQNTLGEIFPRENTLARDELEEWASLDGAELKRRLKAFFNPWWPVSMSPAQIEALRAIIHPETVIRETEDDLKILDLRQERHARSIGTGHRIVYGVAGSGKTVMLIARAKLLAQQPDKRVLVLCFNRLLKEYLREAFYSFPAVDVHSFHSWAKLCGLAWQPDEDGEVFGKRFLEHLQNGGDNRRRYDAVLVDEAQDLPCSWFQCAKLALKDPDHGDLLIVGDGCQKLYRRRPFNWKEAGIRAPGRTVSLKFALDVNYRNTREILQVAGSFAVAPVTAPTTEPDGVEGMPPDTRKAKRNGPPPQLISLASRSEEHDYAAALIQMWLLGGVMVQGQLQKLSANDIAVLYPHRGGNAEALMLAALQQRLGTFTRSVLLSSAHKQNKLHHDGVKILPYRISRGLQFRAVILLWTDMFPTAGGSHTATERAELYVAMTRAEDVLIVLHSGNSPFVDEIRANIASMAASA